jgi:hypothetical protein
LLNFFIELFFLFLLFLQISENIVGEYILHVFLEGGKFPSQGGFNFICGAYDVLICLFSAG